MKKQKKILPIGLGILAIAIILLVVGKKAGWFGSELTVKVLAETVETHTITEQITANGKIQPRTEVKISPDVSGEIIDLFVEEGDQVKAGDPLVVIKPDMYKSSLNRAEAALNSSHARLAQSQAQLIERELAYKRADQLYKSQTIPLSEYETAQAGFKVAEAEVKAAEYAVKSAEASVSEATEQLTKTRIFAPIPGTVSRLNVEKGERVVGTNMYAGTEMMVVADLDKMEVQVDVNENDIVKVSLGDTALIEVDAYINRKFKGIVTEIANSARTTGTTSDQVTNFEVKIFLLQSSYQDLIDSAKVVFYPFRPGMSATVDIQTLTRPDVISVPVQAVTTRLKNDTTLKASSIVLKENANVKEEKDEVVFKIRDSRAFKTIVKTGIQDNNNIEILEGLKPGEQIITAPYNAVSKTLKDSMLVKIVTEKELYKVEKEK
jgi:HlyD family secretion protein